jgi:hypothetical protein
LNSQDEHRKQRRIYRKRLIMPTEHGSWSWLLVPFGVGAGVAGQFNIALILTLVAGLSVFFMRQPATVWMRARRGRARKVDGPIAAGWALGFGLLATLCLLGLLALGRAEILWLVGPLVVIFLGYLLAARYGRAGLRSLRMELAGAEALAMMAPAALVAANGTFTGDEWVLWGIMAAQNVLGALYVRLRIHDTHNQDISRAMILWGHVGGLGVAAVAGLAGAAPLPALFPFVAFLLRAIWAVKDVRPVENIKRFGFTEMGIEIVSGAWIGFSYWLGN